MFDLSRRFEVPGFSLAWDVWGDAPGPPLVLVHGYAGSAHDFALHIDALAEHRRVFAIDHRGHGASSNSDDPETYTVDHIVDDLVAWTSEIVAPDGQPFDLLGHSMGGRVALRYALTRRDLVRSLVLFATTAWEFGPSESPVREVILLYLEALKPKQTLPMPAPGPEDAVIEASVPAEWLRARRAVRDQFDPMAAKALGLAIFDGGLSPIGHQLGDIDCPTSIVVGSKDHPYLEHGARLRDAISQAELTVIEGGYHSPQLTHPHAWHAAIERHLARVENLRL